MSTILIAKEYSYVCVPVMRFFFIKRVSTFRFKNLNQDFIEILKYKKHMEISTNEEITITIESDELTAS